MIKFKKPFLLLFFLLFTGCASKAKVDNTPLISANATPTATPSTLSQALPANVAVETFSSLPTKNDLVDGFYYYANTSRTEQVSDRAVPLRIRLAVRGDKACYLATGIGGTDFEMESLVREKEFVWRGSHTNRYLTQTKLNTLVVYASDTDKIGSYTNKSITGDDVRDVTSLLSARNNAVSNITRLTLSRPIETVYRDTCLNFEPIYFRGKLPRSETVSAVAEVEASLDKIPAVAPIAPTDAPPPVSTATPTVTPKP